MLLELMKNRFSTRDYKDTPVEEEKLNKILEAGRLAPTAKNLQPVFIYVVKSEKSLKTLREITKNAYNAPVVLIICKNTNEEWERGYDGFLSGDVDSAIVTDHMMLMCEELGLNTVWACSFDKAKVIEAFDIPENLVPVSLLPVGYKSDNALPSERHSQRKNIAEMSKEI